MSRYRKTMLEALQQVYKVKEQDEKDHEVSMARGELEAIADKATQLASMLQSKSDEGNPLEAWVQSKITKAKDYITSVSDYLTYNPDMKQNEETILEKSFTSQQIKQAYGILNDPRYKGGNYDGAVKAIEKLAKGLSDHPDVKNALKRANEDTQRPSPAKPNSKELDEVDNYPTSDINKKKKDGYTDPKKGEKKIVDPEPKLEGRMSDIDAMRKKGASAEKIAKELGLSIKTVKDILGESNEDLYLDLIDEKVADSIIKNLQKSYADLKGKTISPEMANKLSKHLDQPSYDLDTLRQLVKANIPFISTLARNKIYKKTGKFEEKRLQIESLVALKNKAEKTGMPYNILKQVYDRGMAAWKSGHRPGAGQQQWALARVNSFVTKSSGTWGGADKDLAAKVKGEK